MSPEEFARDPIREAPFPRETATQEADLPHPFENWHVKAVCRLCRQPEGDQRHVAWERRKEQAAEYPTLPREQGA